MSNVYSRSLVILSLGLPALACGTDPASDATSDSSGGQTSMNTTGEPPATGTTPPADSGSTANLPSSTSSSDGGSETASPPSFDLGVIPDMPKEPPPKLPEFDCSAIPNSFVSFQVIPGARGYHGLAITPDGLIIGSDGSSLIDSTYEGVWGVFIPGIGSGQQFDWLPDGDMAHATSNNSITRIRLDATTEVIQAGINAYSVVVGPDDQIYATDNSGGNGIYRIDPEGGGQETLLPTNGSNLHSIGFSPDGQRIYVGTVGSGTVYYVDLDVDMNPTTGLEVFATQVGNGGNGWHDAVAVDLCGYIYVPDYFSRNLYRISPSGEVVLFWDPANQGHYAHGLTWGTGEFGWQENALYFPQPYNNNSVGEVVVGVPPSDWPAIPINVPPSL